jgi:hypothetical protein
MAGGGEGLRSAAGGVEEVEAGGGVEVVLPGGLLLGGMLLFMGMPLLVEPGGMDQEAGAGEEPEGP